MSHDPFAPYQHAAHAGWEALCPLIADHESCLQPMLSHHFKSLGKLLRPALTLAFYERLTGEPCTESSAIPPALLHSALAIEVLHNATLIHDDLQDGDETRRGLPTVWKHFDAYQAINAGTALYFHAQRLLLELPISPEIRLQLLSALVEQTLAIIAGQTLEKDIWQAFRPDAFEDAKALYLDVVEKKTSALFALPLIVAAIHAHEDPDAIASLGKIARPLGALFQIQDDLLDLYGAKGRQEAGGDIAEGKPSLLVLHGLYHLPAPDAEILRTIVRKPRLETSHDEILWASDTLRRSGAIQACLAEIDRLHEHALSACQTLAFRRSSPALPAFLRLVVAKILEPIQHLR